MVLGFGFEDGIETGFNIVNVLGLELLVGLCGKAEYMMELVKLVTKGSEFFDQGGEAVVKGAQGLKCFAELAFFGLEGI